MAFRHAAWLFGFGAFALAVAACSESGSDLFSGQGGASAGGNGGKAGTATGGAGGSGIAGAGNNSGGTVAGTSNPGAGSGGETEAGAAGTTSMGGAGAGAGAGGDIGNGGSASLGGAGGAAECDVVVKQQVLAPGTHVTECTPVDYATNPPSSGSHYPVWADFGAYDFPLPRGYWVHNLEHGAVVVTYNCTGCDAEVAQAAAWIKTLKTDATCVPGPARILLVPDPKLDVPWAASSWGYTLRAQCFDAAAFSAFYNAHAGQAPAPEIPVCSTGFNFRLDGNTACGSKP